MADFLSMMEEGIPSNISVKKNKQTMYTTPVMFTTCEDYNDVQYTFIVDKNLSITQLDFLKKVIYKKGIMLYQILRSTKVDIDESKALADQYINFKWNFQNYIKPWTKIICFGRAMFSICESTDLDCSVKSSEESVDKKLERNSIIEGFYDTLLEYSHFNDPTTKCVCFPVDSWIDLLKSETGLFADHFEYKFFKEQMSRAMNYVVKPLKIKAVKYEVIENPNIWMLNEIDTKPKNSIVAWDTETKGLDQWSPSGKVRCITISYYDNPYIGYYLDMSKIDVKILEKYLLHFLHNGSNLNFDYKWLIVKLLLSKKIINKQIYDTQHLSQIVNNNQRNSLKSNVWIVTWFGGYDKELDLYIKNHPEIKKDYSLIPEEINIPYASKDPCMSNLVHIEFEKIVHELDKQYPITFVAESKWSMWRFYTELRIPTQRVFTKAEISGAKIRWDKVAKVSTYLITKIKSVEDRIKELLKITDPLFNISSNDQLGQHIEKLKYKCYGRSKNEVYSVNVDTLQKWNEDGHEWAKLIDELHGLQTLYKTFVGREEENTGYYQYRKFDDSVHSTFGVGMNSTGRNNSKNPNLQNNKKHGFLSEEVRDFFSPINENDCCICELDGASLQLRIEASLSKDKTMIALFQNNVDIHTLTAHFLFGNAETFEEFSNLVKSGDKKHKEWRQAAKAPNFSLCFNATPLSFAKSSLYTGSYKWELNQCKEYIKLHSLEDLHRNTLKYLLEKPLPGIDDVEVFAHFLTCAKDIKEKWMEKYKGIEQYIEYCITVGKTYGASFTPFGFIRRIPRLKFSTGKDENKMKLKNCENMSTNVSAQTVEWVLISKTMIALDKHIEEHNLKSYLIGNVHDSIVLVMYYDEAYELIKLAKEVFCEDIPENNLVPQGLEADLGIWGFGKGFDLDGLVQSDIVREKVISKMKEVRAKTIYKDVA